MATLENIISKNIEARKLKSLVKTFLKTNDINFAELEVMYYINHHKEANPSEIANHLCSERATISRCLRTLNEKSLITYNYDAGDKRMVFVTLSNNGIALFKNINKFVSKNSL